MKYFYTILHYKYSIDTVNYVRKMHISSNYSLISFISKPIKTVCTECNVWGNDYRTLNAIKQTLINNYFQSTSVHFWDHSNNNYFWFSNDEIRYNQCVFPFTYLLISVAINSIFLSETILSCIIVKSLKLSNNVDDLLYLKRGYQNILK